MPGFGANWRIERPCRRCVKKGIDDTCKDTARRPAKYLDPEEMNQLQAEDSLKGFSSDAANLEYDILSAMLGQDRGPLLEHVLASNLLLTSTAVPQVTEDAKPTVYATVTHPYDYREGFHHLVQHVKEKMEKEDIMRICYALAHFRPSFMAQIINLSEQDLVFVEQCLQRSLIEFEKMISYSGTPTVVWRRTGEICLVGKEFSLLTEWTAQQLLSKKTYIYELMDTPSAVEYWEKFSLIAFDNSQQSVMTTCKLVTASGRKLQCALCFTIKRDLFEVPMVIVGNFLPTFEAN